VVLSLLALGCDGQTRTLDPMGEPEPPPVQGSDVPPDTTSPPPPDTGTPQDGTGTEQPPTEPPPDPGPWPVDARLDYTVSFGVGTPQSVGLDEGFNLWLLQGDRIGVLRPGDSKPTWTRGIGQASQPFGRDSLAIDSTVICGGEAGRAYVGYRTDEM
jgi:hypothetical protein